VGEHDRYVLLAHYHDWPPSLIDQQDPDKIDEILAYDVVMEELDAERRRAEQQRSQPNPYAD
jgi:hypothetical protein